MTESFKKLLIFEFNLFVMQRKSDTRRRDTVIKLSNEVQRSEKFPFLEECFEGF